MDAADMRSNDSDTRTEVNNSSRGRWTDAGWTTDGSAARTVSRATRIVSRTREAAVESATQLSLSFSPRTQYALYALLFLMGPRDAVGAIGIHGGTPR